MSNLRNVAAENQAAEAFRAIRPRCPCSGCRSKAAAADGEAYWHTTEGPAPVLARLHRTSGVRVAQWVDHPYRYRRPDGRWCWVAEPYSLSARAFADFAALEDAGYEVYISAGDARHYPGPMTTNTGGYDDVRFVDALPRKASTYNKIVQHGYAVGMSVRRAGQLWLFFDALEPALACGRAARMSPTVSGYGVYHAAQELGGGDPHSEGRPRREPARLFVAGESLDRRPGEDADLTRWLRGVRPDSAYWAPPARRRSNREIAAVVRTTPKTVA